MAKDSMGTIIGLGVAGVAGYWLYTKFFSAAPAPVTSAPHETTNPGANPTPTPAVPDWMANLDALRQKLESMGGVASNNVDQWVFQYNQLRQQRNMPQLTGAQVAAILSVNPATVADRSKAIPSGEFVNDIFGLGYGLSGVRGMGAWPIMPLAFRRRVS